MAARQSYDTIGDQAKGLRHVLGPAWQQLTEG